MRMIAVGCSGSYPGLESPASCYPVSYTHLDVYKRQVFQRFNLFPHMTALANIMEAPVLVRGLGKAAAQQRARQLLERVGLADRADAYPGQLSG